MKTKKILSILIILILVLSSMFTVACTNTDSKPDSDDTGKQTDITDNTSGGSSGGSSGGTSGGSSSADTADTDETFYIGMFGMEPNQDSERFARFADAVNGDTYNVFMLSIYSTDEELDKYCQMIYDQGKKFWLYAMDLVWKYESSGPVVREDAYKRLNEFRARAAGKSWYDAMLGLHIDEPLLQGMTLDALHEGSKAINFVFPEKRFWVNFGGFAFNEDIPSSNERMTVEAGEYITDLSYDLYGELNDTILDTYDNMVNMFKGKGKYFWAIPMTMFYASRSTEAQCIDHVKTFYEKVKNTEGGCGLLLYTGTTFSWDLEQIGNIGYYDMLTSKEEFMTWKDRKKPWSIAYNALYDESGNPINGGYSPWTNLKEEIESKASEINEYNKQHAKLIDTEIIVENNQVFEYNGSKQYPKPSPDYLNYSYEFIEKETEIVSNIAPSAIGKYTVKITLPASKFRAGKTVSVDFEIVAATKTLIDESKITTSYTTSYSYIAVEQSGLTYSTDGINYSDYVKGTKIDVTSLVVRSQYANCIYFKQGDKEPYVIPVATYKEKAFFLFEGDSLDQWSHFVIAGNKKHSGSQSAYMSKDKSAKVNDTLYRSYLYTNTSEIYDNSNCSAVGSRYLECWVYAEEDVDSFQLMLSCRNWVSTSSKTVASLQANKWTKLQFDLSDLTDPEVALEGIIMLNFETSKPVSFYIDDIYLISL